MKFISITIIILILWIINIPQEETVMVEHVIDGDTVVLSDGRKVRLLQIDAPEKGECGYEAATRELRDAVEGMEVVIESDPRFGDTDDYGRLLRYLHVDDKVVNVDLQQRGFVDTMFYEGQHGRYAYLMNGIGSCAS